jgi:hypothetical protein
MQQMAENGAFKNMTNICTWVTYTLKYIYMTQVYTCYRNTVFILTLLTPSLHNMFRPPGPSSGESQTLSFYISRKLPTQRIRCFCQRQKTNNHTKNNGSVVWEVFLKYKNLMPQTLSFYISRKLPLFLSKTKNKQTNKKQWIR